jgi:RNA recognition motif-containing protein
VTFSDVSVVEEIMAIRTHKILDKKIELKRAYTKEETRDKLMEEKLRKLYIVGIPKTVSEKKVQEYFEQFGEVLDARVIHDPNKGKQKGFGFVLFANSKSLVASQATGGKHAIQGHILECRQTMLKLEANF